MRLETIGRTKIKEWATLKFMSIENNFLLYSLPFWPMAPLPECQRCFFFSFCLCVYMCASTRKRVLLWWKQNFNTRFHYTRCASDWTWPKKSVRVLNEGKISLATQPMNEFMQSNNFFCMKPYSILTGQSKSAPISCLLIGLCVSLRTHFQCANSKYQIAHMLHQVINILNEKFFSSFNNEKKTQTGEYYFDFGCAGLHNIPQWNFQEKWCSIDSDKCAVPNVCFEHTSPYLHYSRNVRRGRLQRKILSNSKLNVSIISFGTTITSIIT